MDLKSHAHLPLPGLLISVVRCAHLPKTRGRWGSLGRGSANNKNGRWASPQLFAPPGTITQACVWRHWRTAFFRDTILSGGRSQLHFLPD